MSQQAIWKDLVKKSFRQNYKFSVEAQHNWFPGHMHKGLGQIQRRMADVDCVLEVHDARVPFSGRNLTFRENLNKSRPHILLLNKQDLFPESEKDKVKKELLTGAVADVIWTNCKDRDDPGVTSIMDKVVQLLHQRSKEGSIKPYNTVLVVGIPNVGKSTIINKLRGFHLRIGGRPAPVAARPGWTKSVGERIRVCDDPCIYLLDSPGISVPQITDMHSGMKLAACGTLQDHLVGEEHIVDYLLYWLNIHHCFDYVEAMGLKQPEDDGSLMLAKAAISAGKFRTIRDVRVGSGMTKLPNLQLMSHKFLKLFRSGHFGLVNLDTDLLNEDKLSYNIRNKKAKIY